MDFEFRSPDLLRLATDAAFSLGFPEGVEKAFRKRVQAIAAAADERDLYMMKSHRFEKLKGDRRHQHSMRLNDRFRLILEIRKGNRRNTIILVGIEDYH
jgi:proteic killer suppression protein